MLTKRQKKRLIRLILVGILALVGAFLESDDPGSPGERAFVERVVDGDTFVLSNDQRVRLIGVDTPETVHPTKEVEFYGKEASEYLKALIEKEEVTLVSDVSDTDRYGRLLRYVYLEDGTFVNHQLVAMGYARVVTYPPDVMHQELFLEAEREARSQRRGLWQEEGDE